MALTICRLKWLKALLGSFGTNHPPVIKLFGDQNKPEIWDITQDPVFKKRIKHIDVDCPYAYDVAQDDTIDSLSCFYLKEGFEQTTVSLSSPSTGFMILILGIRK